MRGVIETPFGEPVPEIPLPSAPLVFVVGQARFERIASISSEAFVAGFQEALRPTYPLMRHEQQAGILVRPDGAVAQAEGSVVWRLDEQPSQWQVTLSPDSVALATSTYTSRADFISRLDAVLEAAQRHLGIRFCERLGIRYVDRVGDPQLEQLDNLVRASLLATITEPVGEKGTQLLHSFSDSTYRLSDGTEVHARWGLLPADATLDPAIAPADDKTWLLDLDAYTLSRERFERSKLVARAEVLAQRVYRFFRWAVLDDFLKAYGGAL
jgi:uncharacterized protein (TIGR04255 family)